MDRPRILVVQPAEEDPVARLGDWLAEAGAELVLVEAYREPVPSSLDGFRGLVCLGGVMGAYDDADYPWLAEIRQRLAEGVTSRLPTLAICLGAELLAAATGGTVRRMAGGPVVGMRLVAKRDAATEDVLFGELPHLPDVLEYHGDEIVTLPAAATLLASSPQCANEAFRVGPCGYGVQFHIETTPTVVLDWAARGPETAAFARDGELSLEQLAAAHEELAQTWRPFAHRFVELAAGERAPTPQALPLAQR